MADSVSPGSSQRGASVTWKAYVAWPAGPAACESPVGAVSVAMARRSAALQSLGLDTRTAQNRLDVLRLRLARAGVDLADHLDGRRGDGRGHTHLAALHDDVAVHEVDLGRPALGHVLAHRGAPVAPARRRRGELAIQLLVDVALVGRCPLLGGVAIELGNLVAEREPDPRRLGPEVDRDRSADLARLDLERAEAGHGLHGVAGAVGAKLRPALAPQVVGCQGTVDDREHLGDFLRAGGDAPVVLAHAEHVVAGPLSLFRAALDLSGLPQRHTDLRHDEPQRARRAGD